MWTENEIRMGRLPKTLDDLNTTDRPLVETSNEPSREKLSGPVQQHSKTKSQE
jgi:hypothetical protein